jgi:hypothetical protein
MSVFTKDDLKHLYEEEICNQQNKCVENLVQHMKRLVISKAKEGKTSTVYQNTDINNCYSNEWVKSQILGDLKRIFPDSIVDVSSVGLDLATITISISWE